MWQDDPLICKLDKAIRANRETTSHARGEFSVWQEVKNEEKCAEIEKLLVDLNQSSAALSIEITQLEGRLDEIKWSLAYLQP